MCCVTKNLLAFYVDRVFKDHQELNPHILRKISSIANSFLYMQKALQKCVSHPLVFQASVPSAPGRSQDELVQTALLKRFLETKQSPACLGAELSGASSRARSLPTPSQTQVPSHAVLLG